MSIYGRKDRKSDSDQMDLKKRILVLVPYYLPGYRAGGPIRSIANMVAHIGDQYDFYIVTLNHDFGNDQPYEGLETGVWTSYGQSKGLYLKPQEIGRNVLSHPAIRSQKFELIYLNSFFEFRFSINPSLNLFFGKNEFEKVLIAPRGEFSSKALGIKPWKKHLYLTVVKFLGVYKKVTWQASSIHELNDIKTHFKKYKGLIEAPNFPEVLKEINPSKNRTKDTGKLKVIFLARVSRMKNLDGALEVLKGVEADVTFDIYGPLEDQEYYQTCCIIAATLPKNITLNFCGMISHQMVSETIKQYDLFFLPTLGENYGHSIVESFNVGCPVLISDKTPWRNLKKMNAGWDIPLGDTLLFTKVINELALMNEETYGGFRVGAWAFGQKIQRNASVRINYEALFR